MNKETVMIDDRVNPDHYKKNKVETIDIIKNSMSLESFKGFLKGNIFKYVSRYSYKNGIEDLQKAKWYLNYLIEVEEKNENN